MKLIGRLWRTVRHLKGRQVTYQVVNRLRSRAVLRLPETVPENQFLHVPEAAKSVSWRDGTFTLLNQSVNLACLTNSAVRKGLNWNYAANGKLWTYNLNYFDFLNQPDLPTHQGLDFMLDFIRQTSGITDGLEPYPTSLRIINWAQFLSRNQIRDSAINRHLFAQADLLNRRLEYHLTGNHLLENGFSLLTAALYFRHKGWWRRAAELVRAELTIQVLADGGHDERSPMYHQVLLDRLLDVLLALRNDQWQNDSAFVNFLSQKAKQMLNWLRAVTFTNGDLPMVNDAAWDIAPTTGHLVEKAQHIGIHIEKSQLVESGYRMLRAGRYEVFADVGAIGPDHQPGHAHADTLSFVLYVDNRPLIVDSGTSTYELGLRRKWERSTAAHNTVEVNGQNSSEVWAGFRVGWRARVTVIGETPTMLTARHDGYTQLGVTHERTWFVGPATVQLTDRLLGVGSPPGVARFHFHPDIVVRILDDTVLAGPVQLSFRAEGPFALRLTNYNMAAGFNRLRTGQCLDVSFLHSLRTLITRPI
ncbi:heparinase II/III domain-containing protein [Spirosoma fluminis]